MWRASLESRAAGKVSVLACVETVFAVALYWWIAIRWDTHWHLVTSVFVAPLLLLRSPESVAAGVRWFMKDWFGFELYEQWPKAKRWVWIAVMAIASFSFAHWLVGIAGLDERAQWGLFWSAALISMTTIAIAGAITSAIAGAVVVGPVADVIAAEGVGAITVSIAAVGAVAVAGAIAIIGAVAGAAAVGVAFVLAVRVRNHKRTAFGGTVAGAAVRGYGAAAGLALRAFLFRIAATLRFAPLGVTHIPSNWRENNLLTDILIPAELLPGIRAKRKRFALDGAFAHFQKREIGNRVYWVVLVPFLFLPAFLYRLNIKATAWFWWPLAFLLRPVKQPTVAEDQKEALCWPWTNPFQKLLFVGISLLSMAVLFVRHVDPVRWSRLSKVEGVWTPVKALLALDWSHFPPWHWAIFVSAVCGIGMLALAGGAVSCSVNKKWPPPGLGRKVKVMAGFRRVRSLATVALLLFSLGALFIAHTPWHAHVPLPVSWYGAMKKFYRVADPVKGAQAHPARELRAESVSDTIRHLHWFTKHRRERHRTSDGESVEHWTL